MDMFGIGAAIKGCVSVYFQSARATGRTTLLLESVQAGDRVVFRNDREAFRFNQALRDMGKTNITCTVVKPERPGDIFSIPTSKGRTVFDHMWLQDFYECRIDQINQEIDHYQRESSGYGAAHIKTKIAAESICKWRL
jgi:hypothetical protein